MLYWSDRLISSSRRVSLWWGLRGEIWKTATLLRGPSLKLGGSQPSAHHGSRDTRGPRHREIHGDVIITTSTIKKEQHFNQNLSSILESSTLLILLISIIPSKEIKHCCKTKRVTVLNITPPRGHVKWLYFFISEGKTDFGPHNLDIWLWTYDNCLFVYIWRKHYQLYQ